MLRKVSLFLIVNLFLIGGCQEREVEQVNQYEQNMKAVVHIQAIDHDAPEFGFYTKEGRGMSWQGSGAFVSSDGIIVTAAHVVRDADEFYVTLRDGTEVKAEYFYVADNMDVGFLKIDTVYDMPFVEFAGEAPELGDTIYIYGHPLGDMNLWSMTKGIVSNTERDCGGFFGEFDMYQGDAASWPGNSGGVVLNEANQVIGILVGGIRGSDNMSYITPGWIAEEWLEVFEEWLDTRYPHAKET
jgi:serine protease Do